MNSVFGSGSFPSESAISITGAAGNLTFTWVSKRTLKKEVKDTNQDGEINDGSHDPVFLLRRKQSPEPYPFPRCTGQYARSVNGKDVGNDQVADA